MATQNNVVIATFGTGRDARTRSLFQYDYGITLKIEGIELPSTYEVHFTNFEHMGQATVVIGGSSGEITIPQASLANGNDIEAYIYLHASGNDGETVYHVKIPIIPRAKPNYDTPTPEEQTVIQTLVAQVEECGEEVDRLSDEIHDPDTGVWKAIADIHAANASQQTAINNLDKRTVFVTPEFYGAVGDGVTDDTTAVQNAFNSDLPVLLTKKYAISSGLTIDKDKYVVCDADAEILPIANIETMLTVGGGTTEPTNPVMPGLIKVIWSGGTFNCENGSYKAEVGIDLQKLYHSKFSDISIINVNYGTGMSWSGTYGALAIAENVSVRGSASRMAKYGFKIARNDQRLYNCSAVDCFDGYLIQNAYTRLLGCHVWVTRSTNWANTFGYRVNANHCGFIECTVDTVHTGFIFTSSVQTCVITNLFWLNNTDVVPNYSGMTLFQGINTTDYISVQCSVNNLQCQSFTQDVTLKKYLADNNMFPIISLEANDVSHITDYNIAIQPENEHQSIIDLRRDLDNSMPTFTYEQSNKNLTITFLST